VDPHQEQAVTFPRGGLTSGFRLRRLRRFESALIVLAALSPLAACDVPTALPRWNTRWLLPLDSSRISVSSLLPSGVQLTGDVFALDLPSVTFGRTLAQMCGTPCVAAAGQVVPKPAFTTTFGTQIDLPADVASAQLTAGQLQVSLSHTLSFDPIRPSATARGYIVLSAVSGGRVVARDSISGTTTAFSPGTVLHRTVPISAGPLTPPIEVTVRVFSPAGDPVTVDPTQRITIVVTPQQARVSQVEIRVVNRAVTASEVELDLQDLDATVIDQVREGALRVDVENPFALGGTLAVEISWPSGTVRKTIELAPGSSQYRIPLSEQEIHSFLAQPSVQISVTGTLSAPSGTITVTPLQAVVIRPRLELTLGTVD
jgi:hypothetical protein